LSYWILGPLVLCALIAAAYLPPSGVDRYGRSLSSQPPQELARRNVERRLAQANESLILLEQRDSILGLIQDRGSQPSDSPVLLVDGTLAPALGVRVAGLVEEAWGVVEPAHSGVLTAVAAIVDTMRVGSGGLPRQRGGSMTRVRYFLPHSTDGRTCLVLVSLGSRDINLAATGDLRQIRLFEETLLGPCSFYGAFGIPGPGVSAWLEAHRYSVARVASWSAPAAWPEERYGTRWVVQLREAQQSRFLPALPFNMLGCAGGDLAGCKSAVLSDVASSSIGADLWTYRALLASQLHGVVRTDLTGYSGFSLVDPLLSDLAFELGRDRFADFWTATLPVDSAFTRAMGVSLEAWTMRWVQARFGALRTRPGLSSAGVLMSVMLCVLGVVVAVSFAARQQVG
jgi:hypothetical protein